MENWKELYNERLCTAEEAVNLIKSGDHVVFSHCAAEPTVLIDAMIANAAAYRDVTVHHMQTLGPGNMPSRNTKIIFTSTAGFSALPRASA